MVQYTKYIAGAYALYLLIFSCQFYFLSAYYNPNYQTIDWALMSSFKLTFGDQFAENYQLLTQDLPVLSIFQFLGMFIFKQIALSITLALICVVSNNSKDQEMKMEESKFDLCKALCFCNIPNHKDELIINKKDIRTSRAIKNQNNTDYVQQLNILVFNARCIGQHVRTYSLKQAHIIANEIKLRRFLRDPVLHAQRNAIQNLKQRQCIFQISKGLAVEFNINYISYLQSFHHMITLENWLYDSMIEFQEDRIRQLDARRIEEKNNQTDVIKFIMYFEEPVQEVLCEQGQLIDIIKMLKFEKDTIKELGEFKEPQKFK